MRNGVSLKTELALQGALGPIKQGETVHGDDEVWNDQGDLRVHVIVPNTSLGCGYVTGWVSFKTLTPLNDDGTPLPRPTFWTHELTVRLQENFEWGYRQASVQTLIRKIKQDVDDMRAESKKASEGGAHIVSLSEWPGFIRSSSAIRCCSTPLSRRCSSLRTTSRARLTSLRR